MTYYHHHFIEDDLIICRKDIVPEESMGIDISDVYRPWASAQDHGAASSLLSTSLYFIKHFPGVAHWVPRFLYCGLILRDHLSSEIRKVAFVYSCSSSYAFWDSHTQAAVHLQVRKLLTLFSIVRRDASCRKVLSTSLPVSYSFFKCSPASCVSWILPTSFSVSLVCVSLWAAAVLRKEERKFGYQFDCHGEINYSLL